MNYFKLKFLLLFFALAVALPPAWAGEESVTFSEQGYSNQEVITSYEGSNFSISFDKGTNTNAPKYYTSGEAIRVYGGSTMTVTSENDITKIELSFASGEGSNAITTDVGTYSNGTWSGSSKSVKFTVGGTTGHRRISSVKVTYETGGSTVEKVKTPTFSVEPGTYYEAKSVSLSCETEDATIYYTTDGSDPDENSVVYSSAINVDKTMTIKAIAMKGGMDNSSIAEAVYTIIDPSTLTQYRKITNMSEFKDGDYLIVCENNNVAFNGSLATIDAAGNYFGVEIKNSVISTNVEGYFTVQKVSGGNYKFRSASGYAIGRDENKNGMNISNSATVYLNKVSFDNDGNAVITGLNSDNEETIDLQFFNSGINSRFRYYLTTQQPIQLYKKVTGDEPVVETVATPTFSVEEGTYTEAQSVEISCATEGATIYYTIDGTDPTASSTEYTGAIAISETTTLKAIAVKDGQSSAVAEATYTIKTVTSVANLQAANALDDDTEFIYTGEAVVVWRDGNQMWLQDPNATATEGGGALVYGNVVSSFSSKDKLKSGWTAKKGTYNNASQFTELSAEKDGYQEASPFERTSINTDNVHEYVLLKGVSISSDKKSLTFPGENGSTLTVYDKFKKLPSTINATSTYDINGIIVLFGGNTLEIYPLGYEEHPAAVVEVKAPEFTYNNEAISGSSVEVNANDKITITSEEGTTLIYTTDGSNPSESATALQTEGNTAEVTITEACTIKAVALDGDANESEVATLAVTISEPAAPLANEFVLVTDINQLAHGKQIIFVNTNTKNDYADAMSSQQRSNNRGVETVAVTENKTVTLNDNGTSPYSTEIFTLEKDGDYWYFKANKTSGYIYAAGGTSNNYLKTSETKIDNAQATISIDGKAIVTFNVSGTGARNLLSYNPNNSPAVYSCYKAEQKPVYIYVEKGDTPEPEPLAVTLPEVPAEHYKVGQEVKVKATVENGSENTLLTYKVGEETLTPDNEGNVTLPNKKAGDVVVTVKATDGDRTANDSKTYVFDAAEALTITLNPANGEYYVGAEAKVNVTVDKAITTNPTITYKFGEEGEAQTYNAENGIVLPTAEAGTINLTVTVDDNGYEHTGENTATGTYTVKAKEPAGLKFVIQKVEGQQDNIYQYFSIGKDPVKPTLENPNNLPVTYSVLSPEGIISINAETGEVTLLGKSGTGSIVAETTGDETHAGGKVYLSFNVRPEVATYKLVTDASKLKADDKFIIVGTNQSGTFGMDMLSYGSNSNPVLGSQKVVIADNKIETNLPEVFTLKAVGSESANWYMQENTYSSQSLTYLTARGDNGLYFQNPGQNSEMSISIASDGEATIQFPNVDAESAKYLRMTKYANARFGRYETTDGSVPIYIYKQVIQEEPTLAFAEETPAKAYVGDELTLTVNNVPEGATLTFTSKPADAVEFDDNGKVTFLKAGEVKITANTTETDEFLPGTVTYTITVENKPVVKTDLEGNNLDLVAVVGKSETGKIIVSGENLKGDITLTLNDTKGVFAIDVTSIAKEDAIGEVTVTYTPKAATGEDFDEAIVTIKSTDAETVTVNLTGMATLPDPELSVSTVTLEMGTEPTGTFTVTGQHLTENVTLTVTEGTAANFEISPASITPNEEGKVDKEVTVTYKGNSTEDEYATITVKSGNEKKEVIVTARVLRTPEIIAEPENLPMAAKVGETATATFNVLGNDLKEVVTLTLNDANGVYTINPESISIKDAEEGATVTVTYAPTAAGSHKATISVTTKDAETATVTLNGTATVPEVVAMPTFSLVAGSYTGPQQVTIYCATEGATISYSTDGGQTWTVGNTVYVDKDMTIMAKASKDGMTVSTTASATYVIITEEAPVTVNIETGYYQIKNLGNGLYANVAGRKTLNFTDAPADKAGTVIYVDVENDGTVKSLRSQAADLQRYADRAMSYVPEVVKIVAQKLNADGSGEILGETGLNKILEKFNECFDHNLHVEQAEGGYRLYGKTPSMQPVVEFYRENKDKVEAKLPNLEAFINSALDKLKAKIGGSSVFTEFKLLDIWDKMGGTLTKPVDDASTMAFYREVLNNKNYVWDFAYQTAMIYVNNLMSHDRWSEVEDKLGEYAQYIDKIKQIRPEFKYYIVQKDGKPDFISEGNKDIIDNAERTIWTLEPRTDFTVNFPEANKHNGEYVTTLYTDFAYTLPKGVTAYTVTEVSTQGVATLTALEGTIPAQTPVLLKSTAAGPQTVTLSTEAGTAPADNLLVGPDYLIKHYKFKTPQVVDIFNYIKDELPGFYDEYVAQYEYLMLKTAGTVGNKYFWNVNSDLAGLKDDCIVRSLAVDENGTLAFSDHWTTETNKAFLVDDASNPQDVIKLPSLRGDINKDGVISITDVTALIDILLDLPARTYLESTDTYPKGLDYEAADVNENKDIEITDVTTLIDILLNMPDQPAQGSGN